MRHRHSVSARYCGSLLIIALLGLSPIGSVQAQPLIDSFFLSADTSGRVREPGGPDFSAFNDRSMIVVDQWGQGDTQGLFGLPGLDGADLDALHRFSTRYSIDVTRNIGGVMIRPGDSFYIFGPDSAAVDFDASDAGVPPNANLDALTVNPLTGNKVLSFDQWFSSPGISLITPADLVEFDGSAFTLYLDGTLLPDGLNLDAAHIFDNGELLVSFDVDAELPGISGSFLTRDDDVVWIDRTTGQVINVVLSMSDAEASWFPADIDALWAEIAVNAGVLRFTVASREVQESASTLTLQVERIDGGETAIQARVTSINGSAVAGSDFTAVDTVLSWGDGEVGPKNFDVTIVNDGIEETLRERFELQLAVESGAATLGTPTRIQFTILDDDGDNLFADGFES